MYRTLNFRIYGGLLFLILILLASCQKEISSEGGTSPVNPVIPDSVKAVYSLVASGSNCSSYTIRGTYTAGVAVNTQDSVLVKVHVTKTGQWAYGPQTKNGVSFSGSGSFRDTGMQTITLLPKGTPAEPGTFTYPLNIGNVSCSFSILVGNGTTTPTSPLKDSLYYKANIGDTAYFEIVTPTNGYVAGSGGGGTDDFEFYSDIGPQVTNPYPLNKTTLIIRKGIFHQYINTSDANVKAFFAPGSYPFTPPSVTPNNEEGIFIYWVDKNGKTWSTINGIQDQTGSNFKIISTTDAPDATGRYYIKVKMQFNCKLYKEGTGEMKVLTNGEMVGYFGHI